MRLRLIHSASLQLAQPMSQPYPVCGGYIEPATSFLCLAQCIVQPRVGGSAALSCSGLSLLDTLTATPPGLCSSGEQVGSPFGESSLAPRVKPRYARTTPVVIIPTCVLSSSSIPYSSIARSGFQVGTWTYLPGSVFMLAHCHAIPHSCL